MEKSKTLHVQLSVYSTEDELYQENAVLGYTLYREAPSCLRRTSISRVTATMATKKHGGPKLRCLMR